MLSQLHITIKYGDDDMGVLLKTLKSRDERWASYNDPEGAYCSLTPAKDFSWASGSLDQSESATALNPPLLLIRWRRLIVMGTLASSEPPITSMTETDVLRQIDEWVSYACEKVSGDLPDASQWNVSRLTSRCFTAFKTTSLRCLGRMLFPGYRTVLDPGTKQVYWECKSVGFGFRELCDNTEGLYTLFEVKLRNSSSVKEAVERLDLGQTVGELIHTDSLQRVTHYYLNRLYGALPIIPSDLEQFRRQIGPNKWDSAFGFATLMQFQTYSPSILVREGFYSSGDTARRRRVTLERAGLWHRPRIQPLSVLPEELLETHPELGSLPLGAEIVWDDADTRKNAGLPRL